MAQMRIDFAGIAVHNRTYRAVGVHKRTFYADTKMPASLRLKHNTYNSFMKIINDKTTSIMTYMIIIYRLYVQDSERA